MNNQTNKTKSQFAYRIYNYNHLIDDKRKYIKTTFCCNMTANIYIGSFLYLL